MSALTLAALLWVAAEPVVSVQAEVVYASTAEGTVEPSLSKMRDDLAKRVQYRTMRTVDSKRLTLTRMKLEKLPLANQKSAELTLQEVKDNVATVKVRLPPTEAVYSLGRDKSLFVQGGAHEGGELWLVLSQPK